MKTFTRVLSCALLLLLFTDRQPLNAANPLKRKAKPSAKTVRGWLRQQPVEFLENAGQMMNSAGKPADNVFFKAEAPGVDLYITDQGLSYVFLAEEERRSGKKEQPGEEKEEVLKYEKVDLVLQGAVIRKENIRREDASDAYHNFYMSKDRMFTNVRRHRKITISNIYPGIDWVLYNSSNSGFKYDFIVRPGADPAAIKLLYRSGDRVQLNERGAIVVRNESGILEEKPPYSYLGENGPEVASRYRLISKEKRQGIYECLFGFELGAYERSQVLVIDPQLIWSTFFGGTSYEGTMVVDCDPSGNVYLGGYLGSNNFPLQNSGTFFQSSYSSSFLTKFSNNGTLLWSTYFPGGPLAYLSCDPNGNLFVTGYATGSVLPVVNNNSYFQAASNGGSDAYIARFDSQGNLTWCTYYGGSFSEISSCIDTDQAGNVYLTGTTSSTNLPVMNSGGYYNALLPGPNSGFISKFSNSGNLLWATYIPAISNILVRCDKKNNVFLAATGYTAMPLHNAGGTSYYQGTSGGNIDLALIKFTAAGNLAWGTLYGGVAQDRAYGLEVDKNGNLFVSGTTLSSDFPVLNAGTFFQGALAGTQADGFVLKFDSTLTRKWATYLGGTRNEAQYENDNLTIDTCGNVFVALTSQSRNLNLQQACDFGMFDNTIDTSKMANGNQVYLTRFSNSGDLMWSTLFGGDGNSFRNALAADNYGNVFFSGEWNSVVNQATYPLMYPGGTSYTAAFMGYEDVYVAKFTNNMPAQSFSYASVCGSGAGITPTLAANFVGGGTFSASPGLSINPATGQILPAASSPGTYTVTYSRAPCYCPGAAAVNLGTATVAVLAVPSLSIAGKTGMCLNEKRTYTVSGSTSYTWSNNSTQPTITVTGSVVASQVYTVSSKAANGCLAQKVLSVTVSKCTGIEETEPAQVLIYPNPNKGDFTVSSDADLDLLLVNELGQPLREIALREHNNRNIQLSGLANGVYILEERGSQRHWKIVVSH